MSHRPVKLELWVCYAVFDQHSEVLCCSQQCRSVDRESHAEPGCIRVTLSQKYYNTCFLTQTGQYQFRVDTRRAPHMSGQSRNSSHSGLFVYLRGNSTLAAFCLVHVYL